MPAASEHASQPASAPQLDLSVVVPVKNEAGNIVPLISEISTALQLIDNKIRFEIIYVDDGSDDGTADELARAKATESRLRVIRHARACGQSRAVISGVAHAVGRFIATLDGDGQNDPASLPAMWARLHSNGSANENLVICGHRKNRKDTGWRKFVSRLANKIRGGLLRDKTPDSGCGLKIFSRAAFLQLPTFDHMHRFLPSLFLRQGLEVVSVEVLHRSRERGTSKYGTWDRLWAGIWDILGVMWLNRRSRYPSVVSIDPPVTTQKQD